MRQPFLTPAARYAGLLGAVALSIAGCNTAATSAGAAWATLDGAPPLVIAHRGASGYLPEHTIEAYALAIEQGADIIEPDLVVTKDGVLIARHDRFLSTTTNVADRPEFADRKRPDPDPAGKAREDWWAEDFTLAEIKTLRARQPRANRPQAHNDLFEVPTFAEVLALAADQAEQRGRTVGVYPETKHPGFFQSIGLDFEAPLLAALEGFDAGPVFIQSFEPEILKRLNGKTPHKLVQLVYEETPGAGPNIPLTEIVGYADGVGPSKDLIDIPDPGQGSSFISTAHRLGLVVHPWTFRDDVPNEKIPYRLSGAVSLYDSPEAIPDHNNNSGEEAATMGDLIDEAAQEYGLFFSLGVDGVFTDFPDTAIRVRDQMKKGAE